MQQPARLEAKAVLAASSLLNTLIAKARDRHGIKVSLLIALRQSERAFSRSGLQAARDESRTVADF